MPISPDPLASPDDASVSAEPMITEDSGLTSGDSAVAPLTFRVAPHLIQDLGLNLYTTLPRVLVEFVANAHDADASTVAITIDHDAIEAARALMRAEARAEKAQHDAARLKWEQAPAATRGPAPEPPKPLAERLLPADLTITVEDTGYGMSREDLQDKFLIAGRRRREEDGRVQTDRNRPIMGRKGLGKLAGFGVAHYVEVTSRKKGEAHATKVTLDYDGLAKARDMSGYPVPTETLEDGGGLPDTGGTRVVLSRLAHDAAKSKADTIRHEIGDHFAQIDPKDFAMTYNGVPIEPTPREFVYAYPDPGVPIDQLVRRRVDVVDDEPIEFDYRIRFTGQNAALRAGQRGVRVYAKHRLAAAPSLLDVDSNMHGFHNTQYLDGVVHADFIDQDERADYIATDRHGLRWDVARLAKMRDVLTEEMKAACKAYQGVRDKEAAAAVTKDLFTSDLIGKANLPKRRRTIAVRIATILASTYERGVDDDEYKRQVRIFIDGLEEGDILGSLETLAKQAFPSLPEVVAKVTALTKRETADSVRYVEGRLRGIDALDKIYRNVSFKNPENEKELHKLFEENPWLLDPLYGEYVTSNQTEGVVLDKLEQELAVGRYTPANYDPTIPAEANPEATNERPDLVFLLGGPLFQRVVIVELKSPNTPLQNNHLEQLQAYMGRVRQWLRAGNAGSHERETEVSGILIGTLPNPKSNARGAVALRENMTQVMSNSPWRVRDIADVLRDTRQVHQAIWAARERILQEDSDDEPEALGVDIEAVAAPSSRSPAGSSATPSKPAAASSTARAAAVAAGARPAREARKKGRLKRGPKGRGGGRR